MLVWQDVQHAKSKVRSSRQREDVMYLQRLVPFFLQCCMEISQEKGALMWLWVLPLGMPCLFGTIGHCRTRLTAFVATCSAWKVHCCAQLGTFPSIKHDEVRDMSASLLTSSVMVCLMNCTCNQCLENNAASNYQCRGQCETRCCSTRLLGMQFLKAFLVVRVSTLAQQRTKWRIVLHILLYLAHSLNLYILVP